MQYQLFIDESGDQSLSSINRDFPIFTLTGCLFTDTAYHQTHQSINKVKTEIFDSKHIILHSRDIRRCEGIFSKLFDLKIKEKFYRSLNTALTQADFTIVAVIIKKKEFIHQYGKLADDPYELSISFLLERMLMETDNSTKSSVSVTIESRGTKEDATLQRRYNTLLDIGSGSITSQRFRQRFTSMRFRFKRDNDIGLQIADLTAYPIARHHLNPEEPLPAYDIIEPKIRRSRGGLTPGYGLKIFP